MKPQYEIINHGYDHSQYFQGCGTYGTDFEHVVTGCGYNAKDAYEDELDQVAMAHDIAYRLPQHPAGIRKRDKVPANAEDCYWYVSIRYNL